MDLKQEFRRNQGAYFTEPYDGAVGDAVGVGPKKDQAVELTCEPVGAAAGMGAPL